MLNSCGFSQNMGWWGEGDQKAWRWKPSTRCFWVGILWQKSSEKPRTLEVASPQGRKGSERGANDVGVPVVRGATVKFLA